MSLAFFRSIRFRLAVTYSLVVFGLAFIVIAGVNYALTQSLDDEPVTRQIQLTTFFDLRGNRVTYAEDVTPQMQALEQLVNQRALESLRRYSLLALLVLFPASIAAGWLIADRALRPIGAITAVAKDIQSGDLSRRIALDGPDDELKELADTFDEMLDRIEAGMETQRRFIQDTSHELRNPLAVMAANLDVALSDPDADAGSLRETAMVVRRTVDRAAQSVDDLVVFARSEVPESVRRSVELGALVDEVMEEYRGPLEERAVSVERVGTGVEVHAEPEQVKRAFSNLVNNAVRHTREGSTIRVGSGRWDGYAWIGVDDQGAGIDPRDHEAVFQRHWSGDDSSLHSERRSGLGLAIARQIAKAHGGDLTLRSVKGAGSAFVLWLPLSAESRGAPVSADGLHPLHDPFADT